MASHLKPENSTEPSSNTQKDIADSWEDEEITSDTEVEQTPHLNPPPPPPSISEARIQFGPDGTPIIQPFNKHLPRTDRRPEKTNAVASRLIAGALGVKAPRRTEEQRAFDRAAREGERRVLEERRAKEEEEKRARESIWGN